MKLISPHAYSLSCVHIFFFFIKLLSIHFNLMHLVGIVISRRKNVMHSIPISLQYLFDFQNTYTMAPRSPIQFFSVFSHYICCLQLFLLFTSCMQPESGSWLFYITCCCCYCCWCCMQTARIIVFCIAMKQRLNRTQNIFVSHTVYRYFFFLLLFAVLLLLLFYFFHVSFIGASIEYWRDTVKLS